MKILIFAMCAVIIAMVHHVGNHVFDIHKSASECMEVGIKQKEIDGINQFFYKCLAAAGDKDFGKNNDIVEQCWKTAEMVYGEENGGEVHDE